MIKIEAITLEEAYENAASSLKCSVTELKIEVVQSPSNGFLGMFKKTAIIVATKEIVEKPQEEIKIEPKVNKKSENKEPKKEEPKKEKKQKKEPKKEIDTEVKKEEPKKEKEVQKEVKKATKKRVEELPKKENTHTILNDTIMPASFVSIQDDEEEEDSSAYLADYDDEEDEVLNEDMLQIAQSVQSEINDLFDFTCFNINKIEVSVYDNNTLLVEFKGEDAALLIGKEGYRYKALSYMIFNWINSKYQVQLRLEIAEFLKNQEESISRYLVGVCENVDRDGRAQTKILDGVLVQIALRELRNKYSDKYVAIRSTRDGMKYIIINDYHSN